jgi:hypothetical protein
VNWDERVIAACLKDRTDRTALGESVIFPTSETKSRKLIPSPGIVEEMEKKKNVIRIVYANGI